MRIPVCKTLRPRLSVCHTCCSACFKRRNVSLAAWDIVEVKATRSTSCLTPKSAEADGADARSPSRMISMLMGQIGRETLPICVHRRPVGFEK